MMRNLITLFLLIGALFIFTIPMGFAKINPKDVEKGHVYLFEDIKGNTAKDSSKAGHDGTIRGAPKSVKGINGKALQFDGKSDTIHLPDSANINSGGPWTNRTIKVIFNCADVSKSKQQNMYEEGGRTRGLCIYVFKGELYIGGWNRAEYNWNGAWISTSIRSEKWYEVALILRDTKGAVEKDKFEMWLDGKLIGKEPGGQLHAHGDDNAIGSVIQNAVFHDEDGSGDGFFFEGLIDEVWILNEALTADDLKVRTVEPMDKLTVTWSTIKVQ